MSEYKMAPIVRIVTAWRKHGEDAEREGNRLMAVNPSVGREMLRDAAQWRSCADTLEREALAAAPAPQDCAVDGAVVNCPKCSADADNRRKRGDYWLTPDGMTELRECFPDREDGNAVRPLLDALTAALPTHKAKTHE